MLWEASIWICLQRIMYCLIKNHLGRVMSFLFFFPLMQFFGDPPLSFVMNHQPGANLLMQTGQHGGAYLPMQTGQHGGASLRMQTGSHGDANQDNKQTRHAGRWTLGKKLLLYPPDQCNPCLRESPSNFSTKFENCISTYPNVLETQWTRWWLDYQPYLIT